MHPNAQLIHNFYTAFQNQNAEEMNSCYHADIQFSDPAFPNLKGSEVSAMWGMLTENLKKSGGSWRLEFNNIQADETTGRAHWEAYYTLSSTGNKVHNVIEATFFFKDGKIIQHIDAFNFYRWASMAFGVKGVLLGWAPFFQKKVQATVKNLLIKYMERSKTSKTDKHQPLG